ncbi:MAG: amidohydrolase family protein, partial [Saprospiraceae bacterium]|nr:amidohydrolase family protein [Saprospiraceae bacterium]
MKKTLLLVFGLCLFLGFRALGQETFPINGVNDHREGYYAFTNATIHKSADETIENATMVIKKGKIISIGTRIPVPDGAITVDLKGKHVYPSFIDLHSDYGMPKVEQQNRRRGTRQMLSNKDGAYMWNQALKPEMRAHEHFSTNEKTAKGLRSNGFGAVLTHQMDGISRGTSSLVHLGSEREHEMIIKEKGAHHLSFSKGSSTQTYPTSLMGAISLIRQTYLDAAWYKDQGDEVNISLDAWLEVQDMPQIFVVNDRLDILRATKIGAEFDKDYIVKTGNDVYMRIDEVKSTGAPLIVPISYPKAYDVEDPYSAMQVTLAQMKHWELAPTNLARLAKAGITFAITSDGLEKGESFMGNLRKAIENGLSEKDAMNALTTVPASLIGADDMLGTLEANKVANFLITSGPIFDEKTKIHHNWVNGQLHVIKETGSEWTLGQYSLKVGDDTYRLDVTGETTSPKMQL